MKNKCKLTLGVNRLILLLIMVMSYLWSYFLLNYYTGGDQEFYVRLYEALKSAKINESLSLTTSHTGGGEPITALILWIGAYFEIEKNIYISILNVILITSLYKICIKYELKPVMVFLVLSNYYLMVLITSAERLKISYIFLFMGVLSTGKIRKIFFLSSPLSHLQNFLLIFSIIFSNQSDKISLFITKLKIQKQDLMNGVTLIFLGIVFLYYFEERIYAKLGVYLDDGGFEHLYKIIILMAISTYLTSNKIKFTLAFLPLIVGAIAIGGSRINMIAFTIVIYFLMKERKMDNIIVYLLMMYFSFKSIGFIYNVLVYGDGF